MGLVVCPDCLKDVSTEAPACPHCGRPNRLTGTNESVRDEREGPFALGVGIIFVASVSLIGIWLFWAGVETIIGNRFDTPDWLATTLGISYCLTGGLFLLAGTMVIYAIRRSKQTPLKDK